MRIQVRQLNRVLRVLPGALVHGLVFGLAALLHTYYYFRGYGRGIEFIAKALSPDGDLFPKLASLNSFRETFRFVSRRDPSRMEMLMVQLASNLGYKGHGKWALYVRRLASNACVELGRPILPVLLRADDTHDELKYCNVIVIYSAIAPGDDETRALLEQAASDGRSAVRRSVVWAASESDAEWARSLVRLATEDPDRDVREDANRIVVEWGQQPGTSGRGRGAPAPDARTIRVFVSSTFRDMHAEREELVKRVFPRFRKRCEERGVSFEYVDLRWGITEEQAGRAGVLPICLAEVEKCRPYFIGILGERYGSVPNRIDERALQSHPWLAGYSDRSLTELEIMHGVLNHPGSRDRAFFYFRAPTPSGRDPGPESSDAGPEDPSARAKLDALKSRIRAGGFTVREGYTGPGALGVLVFDDLTTMLDRLYPTVDVPDPLARNAAAHESFALNLSRVYVGRQSYLDQLFAHADGDGPPLVVAGAPGSGKSSLLADWALRHKDVYPDIKPLSIRTASAVARLNSLFESLPLIVLVMMASALGSFLMAPSAWGWLGAALAAVLGFFLIGPLAWFFLYFAVIAAFALPPGIMEAFRAGWSGEPLPVRYLLLHFIDATADGSNLTATLRRIARELDLRFKIAHPLESREGDGDGPGAAFEDSLRGSSYFSYLLSGERAVIVIDGLDRLEGSEGDPALGWLPREIPKQTRLIVSTRPGDALEQLLSRGWPILEVSLLEGDERRKLIRDYLGYHSKRLNERLIHRLADAPQAAHPAYLRSVLEELRVFGSHHLLEERLEACLKADSTEALFGLILRRYEQDFDRDRPGLVRDAMSLLWASQRGLTEAELLELLGRDGEPLPQAHWSPLHLAVEASLADRGGRIGFASTFLRVAVEARYLSTDDQRRIIHSCLAEFFDARERDARTVQELAWQLLQIGNWASLSVLLTDLAPLCEEIDWDDDELASFWREIESHSAIRCAVSIQPLLLDPEANGDLLRHMASALAKLDHPESAQVVYERLIGYYRAKENREKLVTVLDRFRRFLHAQERWAEALDVVREVEEIWHTLDPRRVPYALANRASYLLKLDRLREALTLAQEARRLAKSQRNSALAEWIEQTFLQTRLEEERVEKRGEI